MAAVVPAAVGVREVLVVKAAGVKAVPVVQAAPAASEDTMEEAQVVLVARADGEVQVVTVVQVGMVVLEDPVDSVAADPEVIMADLEVVGQVDGKSHENRHAYIVTGS